MGLLHLIFPSTAFLLLLYLDDPILSQLLGPTSLFPTIQPSPLACVVSGFLVQVAGTLCPHTFVYYLYLYLSFVLFLNLISFLTPFLFCSLAHSAAPMRLSMNWRVLNSRHNNNNPMEHAKSLATPWTTDERTAMTEKTTIGPNIF